MYRILVCCHKNRFFRSVILRHEWRPCQILMTAHATDVVGEIGVLCYMPQPFTVRSRKLSQLLRCDRTVFMNIVQQYKEDGQRIVDNLMQVLFLHQLLFRTVNYLLALDLRGGGGFALTKATSTLLDGRKFD